MSNFLFRCDVSPQIGAGHLSRCLSFAEELKALGSSVFFVLRTREFDASNQSLSICDGLKLLNWSITHEDDAKAVVKLCGQYRIDVAVIDHYHGNANYQQILYQSGVHWLQFDGGAQNRFWADWVLNPSLASKECDYLSQKPRGETMFLLGPKYAFLRNEFGHWRPKVKFRKHVQKILLTFGGGDDRGATIFALEATKLLAPSIERIVLISSANRSIPNIEKWLQKNSNIKTTLLIDESEIARNMAETDLAITGGGMTTFETAAMGLPTLIVQIAENQQRNAQGWHKEGIALDLGPIVELNPTFLYRQVVKLIQDVKRREKMSKCAKALVDCLGTQRVAKIIESQKNSHKILDPRIKRSNEDNL